MRNFGQHARGIAVGREIEKQGDGSLRGDGVAQTCGHCVDQAAFDAVIAPYGILQSLTRDADLAAALRSIAGVLRPGGAFGIDLVPDLPRWSEYARRISLRGTGLRRGTHLTLVESVRQDRRRRLTIFDQEYIERRGRRRRTHAFTLTFRTVGVPDMRRRVERAGFQIDAVLGGYDGAPWQSEAETWVILATRQ